MRTPPSFDDALLAVRAAPLKKKTQTKRRT
jgi:hypothetical protein